ncbi:polyribonucleotide nucleotidyltransferase [candidate division BRC1 bacterium HGW-BRC1-1]|jgi:polyribonucleotide nucleotidyltransferase|nr:MAG: polyribonucleotide nucleotidyltransferase [candidate division BRC1 bacterium HGW-BRC1-1]
MTDNSPQATEVRASFGAEELILSTGKVARQANGSVWAQMGGTVVLASVVMAGPRPEPLDFFPLTVDFREKLYAAGRIPGGYFKREGRPTEDEILRARLIDRPLRPLFPKGFKQEVQVYINVLSYDGKYSGDIVALCAASTALYISDIPFNTPVAGVRVGFDGTDYILNPTTDQLETSKLELVVAGTQKAITMVESGADMLTEEQMLAALRFGHEAVAKICKLQEELREKVGKEKFVFVAPERNEELVSKIRDLAKPHFAKINDLFDKQERQTALDTARAEITAALTDAYPDAADVVKKVWEDEYSQSMRESVLEKGVRADGRKLTEVRPIWIETSVLPRVHGSSLFTRGQTQSLGVLTLGTGDDTQNVDYLESTDERNFYLHYNFPSFSVGECRRISGPGRREIGHGHLAQRSIKPIIPDHETFPYTIRLVSEIMESNGSSSMASVCSGTLALMDGGVPIKAPVAGIAMGLILEGEKFAVLSDIMGLEDHLGDMDFKVAGTKDGITALQMDIKIEGITFEIMEKALHQAKEGRQHILGKMLEALPESRSELKPYAPRIEMITINPEKIKDVIGSGGKVIKEIVAKTGAKIDINDNGQVFIASADGEAMARAIKWIQDLTAEADMGAIYTGKVTRIAEFGAFVEILPGRDGLVHISELEPRRVERVEDVCRLGDELMVKVIGIDEKGKIRLSRKQAMYPATKQGEEEGGGGSSDQGDRGDRGGRGGRDRDRDRGGDRGGRGGDRGGRGGSRGGGSDRGGRGGERSDRGGRSGSDRGGEPGVSNEASPNPSPAPEVSDHSGDQASGDTPRILSGDRNERPSTEPAERPWKNEVEDEFNK